MATIYDFKALTSRGKELDFAQFKGKVLLIVNTASKCGFTPQFKGLEELNQKYKDQGFVIVGFPCNQFKEQDPGTDGQIEEFCQLNYGVTFQIMKKIDVNGENADPIFTYLKSKAPTEEYHGMKAKAAKALFKKISDSAKSESDIQWNFTKFLISRDGKTIQRFAPVAEPKDFEKEIVEELKQNAQMTEYNIKTIGVLTSGGDAPGMNAAVRAVTRAAIANNIRVKAIFRGYKGLMDGEIQEFTTQDVSGIIQRGGTILKTARSEEFRTPEGRQRAFETMQREQIDALIVIGGDGSFTGARLLAQEHNVPIIGIPGTIDNDLWGTDSTVGYDTALNTIVDCVDKLRDTGTSHERLFLVEVMGRDAGFLTLNAAIAAGAEAAVIPERATVEEQLEAAIGQGKRKHKNSGIVLVQEHAVEGGARAVAAVIEKNHPEYDTRVTILGHLQRGGSPTAFDRILASRLGCAAIQALLDEQRSVMVGLQNGEVVYVPLTKAIKQKKDIKDDKWQALQVLSI